MGEGDGKVVDLRAYRASKCLPVVEGASDAGCSVSDFPDYKSGELYDRRFLSAYESVKSKLIEFLDREIKRLLSDMSRESRTGLRKLLLEALKEQDAILSLPLIMSNDLLKSYIKDATGDFLSRQNAKMGEVQGCVSSLLRGGISIINEALSEH